MLFFYNGVDLAACSVGGAAGGAEGAGTTMAVASGPYASTGTEEKATAG